MLEGVDHLLLIVILGLLSLRVLLSSFLLGSFGSLGLLAGGARGFGDLRCASVGATADSLFLLGTRLGGGLGSLGSGGGRRSKAKLFSDLPITDLGRISVAVASLFGDNIPVDL